MPKIRIGGDATLTTQNGDDGFGPLLLSNGGSTTEAEVQFTDYDAHVWEDIGQYVSNNTDSVTASTTFTEGGTASSNLVASTTGTGLSEETTGTESPAASSLIGTDLTNGGMHGDTVVWESGWVTGSAGVAGIVGHRLSGSTNDRYGGLWGGSTYTTWAPVGYRLSRAAVYSNLRVYSRATVSKTISHYDGAVSTNLTVTYSAESGVKEDTTGTESNASGDDVGVFFDHTAGADAGHLQMDSDVDETPRGTNIQRTWSTTTSYHASIRDGGSWLTTETDGRTKDPARIGAEDIANLHVYCNAFTSATSPVLAVRVNTTTSTNLTVSPNATGLFSDTTGTETLADGDLVGFIQTATAVSGVTTSVHHVEFPHTAGSGDKTITPAAATAAASAPVAPTPLVISPTIGPEAATAPASAPVAPNPVAISLTRVPDAATAAASAPVAPTPLSISPTMVTPAATAAASAPVAPTPLVISSTFAVQAATASADAPVAPNPIRIDRTRAPPAATADASAPVAPTPLVISPTVVTGAATAGASAPVAPAPIRIDVTRAPDAATAGASAPTPAIAKGATIAPDAATASASAPVAPAPLSISSVFAPPAATASASAPTPTIFIPTGVLLNTRIAELGATEHWPLGEVSGDAQGVINNNDGTVTLGSGERHFAPLNSAGDGSVNFDGATTKIDVTAHSTINNIFDGGGSVFFMFNANSGGEGSGGQIVYKNGAGNGWFLRVNESGANVRIRFFMGFDTTDGIWEQTSFAMPEGTTIIGVLTYDADSDANQPTLYVWDGSSQLTQTVGSGLTETSNSSGTRNTDAAQGLTIGNVSGQTNTFDGEIDEIALFDSVLTQTQAEELIGIAKNANFLQRVSPAAATAAASAPTPAIVKGATLLPAAATAGASAPVAPNPLSISLTRTPDAATAPASAPIPIVIAGGDNTIVSNAATSAASAPVAPNPIRIDVTRTPDAATAAASAPVHGTPLVISPTVVVSAATAAASGPIPSLSISPVFAAAAATAAASALVAPNPLSISPVFAVPAATAGASGPAPALLIGRTLLPAAATAAASGPTPILSVSSTFAVAAATAGASGVLAPNPLVISPVFAVAAATAAASGPIPGLSISPVLVAAAATASASAPVAPSPLIISPILLPAAATAAASGAVPTIAIASGDNTILVGAATAAASGIVPVLAIFNGGDYIVYVPAASLTYTASPPAAELTFAPTPPADDGTDYIINA